MENKKYELLKDDAIKSNWSTLYRIRALRDFNDVKRGDLGGYIEKETNLSHDGNCWVSDNARVFGKARVSGNACIFGDANVFDDACVSGDAKVFDNACVSDNAKVFGGAQVYGDACVSGDAHITNINDYIVIGPIGSIDDYTTFYLTKDKEIMVSCGCFNDTIEKFIKAVNRTHKDNKKYRNQYIGAITYAKCVLYNESIL